MIRKIFFSLILFLSVASFSQQKFNNICIIEKNLVQESKDQYSLYVSFRISYEDLIFSKEDSAFTSGAEFYCEVFEKDKLIERKSINALVTVSDYKNTTDKELFLQALLKFKVNNSVYVVKPAIQRANTNVLFPLNNIEIDLINTPKKVKPVIVRETTLQNEFELLNFENSIPYDANQYVLLIPLPDSLSKHRIQLVRNSVVLLDQVTTVTSNTITVNEINGRLIVRLNPKTGIGHSYVKIVLPESIDEGDLQINIESGKKKIIYNIPVIWLNKPLILNDLELSIRLMKMITDETKVNFLLKEPEESKYSRLKAEWNRITKAGNDGVNPLMMEFYSRAEYALNNLSVNGKRNGPETDRGNIYIKFGKPDNIERKYNDKNDIIEIWKYKNQKREYIFEDTSGKGNYILRN